MSKKTLSAVGISLLATLGGLSVIASVAVLAPAADADASTQTWSGPSSCGAANATETQVPTDAIDVVVTIAGAVGGGGGGENGGDGYGGAGGAGTEIYTTLPVGTGVIDAGDYITAASGCAGASGDTYDKVTGIYGEAGMGWDAGGGGGGGSDSEACFAGTGCIDAFSGFGFAGGGGGSSGLQDLSTGYLLAEAGGGGGGGESMCVASVGGAGGGGGADGGSGTTGGGGGGEGGTTGGGDGGSPAVGGGAGSGATTAGGHGGAGGAPGEGDGYGGFGGIGMVNGGPDFGLDGTSGAGGGGGGGITGGGGGGSGFDCGTGGGGGGGASAVNGQGFDTSASNADYGIGFVSVTFNLDPTDAVSYSAGTGSGTPPSATSGPNGTMITLADPTGLSNPGYTFTGWNDGTATYAAGSTYTLSSGGETITFTAQWAPNPSLGLLSVTAWTVNKSGFLGTIAVTGGTGGYMLSATSGLPAGLTAALSGSTISITGTPTDVGTFANGLVTVTDGVGATATESFSVTINPVPSLGSLSVTAWTVNKSGFSGTIAVTGGTGGYMLSATSGLPAGLTATLSGSTISITGTPTDVGTFANGLVTVTDGVGATATESFSVTINPVPSLGSLSVTAWTVNKSGFSGTIAVTGGTGPYMLSPTSGLPAGLTAALSGSTISITGTPTDVGTFANGLVTVTDGVGATATESFSVTINPVPSLGSLSVTAWTVNKTGFLGTIAVTGGTGGYMLSATSGLPAGLTAALSGSTISITGTPTDVGTFANGLVTVTDGVGATATESFSVTINPVPSLGSLSVTAWTVNKSGFSGTIAVTGGTGPYMLSAISGLPAGLTATLSGSTISITGTPTDVGTFANGLVTVTDGVGATATESFSVTINPGVLSPGAPFNFDTTKGIPTGSVVIGTFTDSDPRAPVSSFSATINWGDGSAPISGTVTQPGGVGTAFDVTASHTYTTLAVFNVTIRVTDTGGSSPIMLTGSISTFPRLVVTAPATATIGNPFSFTVQVVNANGTIDTAYGDTVVFASNGGAAVLPVGDGLVNGQRTFTATLEAPGDQMITATDSVQPAINGASGTIDATYPHFSVVAPATATVGKPFPVSVRALNANGTLDTAYHGIIALTSTSPAVLPTDVTLINGQLTFSATLKNLGPQTITAADTAHPAITGTSGTIGVI